MPWHAEVIMLTLRRYESGRSYDARDQFASTATVHLLGEGRAYVCGLLNDNTAGPIRREDWRELRDLLRDQFGVVQIESERRGQPRGFHTGPAPL